MIEIVRYTPEYRHRWDQFIRTAKNGHFMFERSFMDYHSDRFEDHSLMILRRDQLVGLLPGHMVEREQSNEMTYASHMGLPFAGVISGPAMRTGLMLDLFEKLTTFLCESGVTELFYKAIPSIYHRYPANEDSFALSRAGATIVDAKLTWARFAGCDVIREDKSRRRHAKKALAHGIEVRSGLDIGVFHGLLTRWLHERHGAVPVHTREELELLARRFPEHIQAFGAWRGDDLLAAELIFESATCYRLQYAANTVEGFDLRAYDAIWRWLFTEHFQDSKWIDFGTSVLPGTSDIDSGLVEYKESMGARAVSQNAYLLRIV